MEKIGFLIGDRHWQRFYIGKLLLSRHPSFIIHPSICWQLAGFCFCFFLGWRAGGVTNNTTLTGRLYTSFSHEYSTDVAASQSARQTSQAISQPASKRKPTKAISRKIASDNKLCRQSHQRRSFKPFGRKMDHEDLFVVS